jgi:hypothetical protein
VHALGLEPREQARGLLLGERQHDLHRLLGELEEMRGMQPSARAEPLVGGQQRRAAQSHLARELHQPVAHGLAGVALALLGEEGDLVAVHAQRLL